MAFFKRTAFSVAEYFTPVLTTSQFYKTGQLTPEEYVVTGDQLTAKCTSWHWGKGNETSTKDYLPKDKQYLYTKAVPCPARVLSVTGLILDETAAEDDWTLTTAKNTATDNTATTTTTTATAKASEPTPQPQQPDNAGGSDDDDDIPDLDDMDYGDLGEAEEPTPAPATSAPTTSTQQSTPAPAAAAGSINEVRTYDISIIYDKLYRCPRVYLQGYDSNGKILTEQQVQQDISGDHMNKTVTWEQHPYTNLPCMSIHPCQHAHTMKRMLEIMVDEETDLVKMEQKKIEQEEKDAVAKGQVLGALNNKDVAKSPAANSKKLTSEKEMVEEAWIRVQNRMTVDKSLFLFLKFVATVIPTIDYDNTINFDVF